MTTERATAVDIGHARDLSQRIRHATLLRDLPTLDDAVFEGATGQEHLRILSSFVTAERLALAQREEEVLVDAAKTLDAEAYRNACRAWASMCDDELKDPTAADKITARRKFDLHQLDDGSWHVKGVLESLTGEALQAALRSIDSHRTRMTAPTAAATGYGTWPCSAGSITGSSTENT